ncbi:MAG TPA: hypothetical protein GXX36_12030 [Clostridiaceae bacterium]|nr:hypothetical protein [Clostridiaceae bacterium]
MRHVDALMETEELNALQWTPGNGRTGSSVFNGKSRTRLDMIRPPLQRWCTMVN